MFLGYRAIPEVLGVPVKRDILTNLYSCVCLTYLIFCLVILIEPIKVILIFLSFGNIMQIRNIYKSYLSDVMFILSEDKEKFAPFTK